MKKPVKMLPLLLITLGGLAGGVVNGILGTGGGIIFVYVISRTVRDDRLSPREVFACSMAVTLPISLISLFTYDTDLIADGTFMLSVMIPAAFGGVGGALISRRLRPLLLKRIFAALVIYAGIKMIL